MKEGNNERKSDIQDSGGWHPCYNIKSSFKTQRQRRTRFSDKSGGFNSCFNMDHTIYLRSVRDDPGSFYIVVDEYPQSGCPGE